MTDEKETQKNYHLVSLDSLSAGMLVERPLYVYLTSNDRYVLMANALQPLEPRVLSKLVAIGKVFSSLPEITESYPQLADSVSRVREVCLDAALASFEKGAAIREATLWLAPYVLDPQSTSLAPMFFFYRAFGVPKPETLMFVSDLSVEMYAQSVRLASTAGLIALWLGYCDAGFLRQLAESVFCEQIGFYQSDQSALRAIADEDFKTSMKLLESGSVPGAGALDARFKEVIASKREYAVAGDELAEIVEVARWLSGISQTRLESSRVYRKLKRCMAADEQGENAAERRAA